MTRLDDNIHATGLVLGGIGVLIRGPSGSGKSAIALELLDQWEERGRPASLVSDDRVEIFTRDGRLMMRPAPNIAGLIELRGRGIVKRPFADEAPVDLAIDLVDAFERMPEESELTTELLGIRLARAPVPVAGIADARQQLLLIREAIRGLGSPQRQARQKTT